MTMGMDNVKSALADASVKSGTEQNTSLMQKKSGKFSKKLVMGENNSPRDAAEEWPEPKKVHSLYMIKYRPYDDPILKVELKNADKEINMFSQTRFQIPETSILAKNAPFYQNRAMMKKAKDLAAQKDVEALEGFVDAEVDKFMSLYSSNKEFRDDYERRILPSLDMRQLSRDGRMRNPDEKPLVAQETSEMVAKPYPKQLKEDEISELEKLEKARDKRIEVCEAKLKAIKRAEQIVKAKQAMERKKKLAEKAAARAAIRAQKEAEEKQKEREKRARKKAVASAFAPSEEPTEGYAQVAEVEKAPEIISKPAKEQKTNPVKRVRAKGPNPIPRIILERKKAKKNWAWAAPAAGFFAVVLFVIACSYLF